MAMVVRVAALTNFVETAQRLGLNPQPLLQRVGLSNAIFNNQDHPIPVDAVVTLLEEAASVSGCHTFGLLMAESRQLSHFGVISLLLSHQRTFRDVLNAMIEYRHLMNESLAMCLEDVESRVLIREEIVTEQRRPMRQAHELALGVIYRLGSALLGARWRPYSVNFTHDAPQDLTLHRRVFQCPLEFNSEFNGIVCAATDIDFPNPAADPVMVDYAKRFMQSLPGPGQDSIVLDVKKAVYLMLPVGRATIEQIAIGLGTNVRTLQRQLKQAGTEYSVLVNDVQRDLVLRYMENRNFSLAHVAEMLGFGMPSSFSRWFQGQFGESPSAWRKMHLND